jgi:hypothetical protein
MADAFKKLAQTEVAGFPSTSTLYTVPASTETVIRHIRIVNTSVSDRTIKLWHDGTANSNVILPATTVKAGGWTEFDGTITMETGDTLVGQASAGASLTLTAYGLEVS